MNEEEPAWKTELTAQIEDHFPFVRNMVTRDAIREFVMEHIQAAENRGRQGALYVALSAIQGEQLLDETGISDDLAYDRGVVDSYDAVKRVLSAFEPESS